MLYIAPSSTVYNILFCVFLCLVSSDDALAEITGRDMQTGEQSNTAHEKTSWNIYNEPKITFQNHLN